MRLKDYMATRGKVRSNLPKTALGIWKERSKVFSRTRTYPKIQLVENELRKFLPGLCKRAPHPQLPESTFLSQEHPPLSIKIQFK